MRKPGRFCCALLFSLAIAGFAAEPDLTKPVDVPDPIGLGERLALIDWLQEHKIGVPENAELAELRRAYLSATKPQTAEAGPGDDKGREELAMALWKRHGVGAKPEQSAEQLAAELKRLDDLDAQERQRDQDRAHDGGAEQPENTDEAAAETPGDDKPLPGKPANAAKKPNAASGEIPPVNDENKDKWANYSVASTSTKDRVQLWVYVLKDDRTCFYILSDNRLTRPAKVEFTIDEDRYTVQVPPGKKEIPTAVACVKFSANPSVMVNAVK